MLRLPRLSEIDDDLDAGAFWELLGHIEHERLDFKRQANHLTADIASMAMTDGGMLVLGVDDKRTLVGCRLTQHTLDRVMRAGHACGVDVQAKEIAVDGTGLVLVAVPEVRGRIVTTPDGRLLRRVGSDSQPLVGDALARFVREREDRAAEDETVQAVDFSHLDLELVNQALAGDDRPRATRRSLLRALVDLGVADPPEASMDPRVTRAAVLLFADDPRAYVPAAAVQLVRRTGVGPGPGPIQTRSELAGPIPRVLDAVVAFVDEHTTKYEAVIGTHRETLPEYPSAVLREAVLNALAHRDYGLAGSTVDITIWDDRTEIRSPGPLPGHITLDNMRVEHYSRNRRIMRVLKLLRLVEEYGEGVDRMYEEMEARLMEPPGFVATSSSVTVTLRNRSLIGVEDQAWLALLGHLDLTPHERRALVLARHDGAVTPRALRPAIGSSSVEATLTGAMAKGLLVRVGERGGARYVLSDEVVMRAGVAGVEARSRKRQMLLDEIDRRGSLSTTEALEVLGETDRALVRHLLADLERAKEVTARGRTRARRYYAA